MTMTIQYTIPGMLLSPANDYRSCYTTDHFTFESEVTDEDLLAHLYRNKCFHQDWEHLLWAHVNLLLEYNSNLDSAIIPEESRPHIEKIYCFLYRLNLSQNQRTEWTDWYRYN